MYAERTGWDLQNAKVQLHFYRIGKTEKIDRAVTVTGNPSAEQKARLAEICERT